MNARSNRNATQSASLALSASSNLYDQARLQRTETDGVSAGGESVNTQLSPQEVADEVVITMLKAVRPNIVQSIRAFRPADLEKAAGTLGYHFLYANCANANTKNEVLDTIARSFLFPRHFGKNFDALSDCLTDMPHKAGQQPGFVVVLEGIPSTVKFDKELRETLLDVFREAADFWADRKVTFRVFYAFA